MRIGYARVSSELQSEAAQLDALANFGCERIYHEKISGKGAKRPELTRLLDSLRTGDTVIVQRLDRLGRSLSDLIHLLSVFKKKNVEFGVLRPSPRNRHQNDDGQMNALFVNSSKNCQIIKNRHR
jgi:DNA invertase Pin-like site-specific DNA recombinase